MNTRLPTRPEEALRLSEDHYRVLFDEHPVPMWVYDPDTRLLALVAWRADKGYWQPLKVLATDHGQPTMDHRP